MLAKIKKYKVGLVVLATLVFSIALAPAVLATAADTLGLTYGTSSLVCCQFLLCQEQLRFMLQGIGMFLSMGVSWVTHF